MESICLDTTILIEHYRAKDKSLSKFYSLANNYDFTIPSIVKYEIVRGNIKHDDYWTKFFENFDILSFDSTCADIAGNIYIKLKQISKLIPIDDILIAAISISNNYKLATLNTDHFKRIDGLVLVEI